MGLPAGTGTRSLPAISLNLYARGVAAALIRVGTATSVFSMVSIDLLVFLFGYPNMPQYPPPQPLLCSMYPLSRTF